MAEYPSISVVVPTYYGAGLLERVLRPLLDDPATSELIVVIDGSRDGSKELVDRLAEDEPRLRALFIENRGDMGAREAGAQAAGGEVVLFIDDDVVAHPGLVSGHARRHAERAADIVVGYMPVAVPDRRTSDDFALRLYASAYEGRCDIYERDAESVVRDLWGGNFSMRRSDCLAIGMSNRGFTEHYHADRDFGIRCLEAGLSGTFDRHLSSAHLHERTLDSFVRDARSQGAAAVLMPRFHPDTVPAPQAGYYARDLPRPVSDVVRLTRRPRAYAAAAASMKQLLRLAGAARLWPLQEALARVLRRIEQQHGAIDQSLRRGK
ncbi:MAG: glycosyltransferase family 2 protein [Solirubrobacterales bacterium]|nr:glycosyltransferase family 2 protein [Solirubrobacterales bacterium]